MLQLFIKRFFYTNNSNIILMNFNFFFKENLIYTILGPSGAGKTTLLNLISNLLEPSDGYVAIKENKHLSYMFQEDVLLPWRTLKENILLGLEVLHKTSPLVDYYIKEFGLHGYENYYPEELSGGMRQRTALIRTLITEPDILLLDEPFSNLDFDVKLRIQKILLEYQERKKCTVILVTHDIEDAIALSDEIIILTAKPTQIKNVIKIDSGLRKKDPIEVRKSPLFTNYFKEIWSELKEGGQKNA